MNDRKRVLAVDDDEINLEVLHEILDDEFDFATAANGEEALALAVAWRPDLVLLDVMMPGIDGYETCRRIRANPDLRSLKVVLVTAKAMKRERLSGYEAGADDYLTKPFDKDELLAKVRVFLRLKSEEELSRMKSDLLDLVAHEIRTPLTGILPTAELLAGTDPLDERERIELAAIVHANARRLETLAEKALLLCQLRNAGPEQLRREWFSLDELVDRVLEQVASRARTKRMVVTGRVGAMRVFADRKALEAALRALVDNAIEFSPPGAEVVVAAVDRERAVEFSVMNPGPGIEPDRLARLLDAFGERRAHGQTVGAGVTMALVREVLRAHGGELRAESEPGIRTTISGVLPRPPAHAAAAATLAAVAARTGGAAASLRRS
jgi:signal transduction histidine kinase